MAIGQRLYTRRLCLLPHPQRNREGRLQLGRIPEGARVPGHYALASRVAANPEASGALERNDVAGESGPLHQMLMADCRARSRVRGNRIVGNFLSAIEHVEPLRGSTPPAIKRCGLRPLNTCGKCETFQRFHVTADVISFLGWRPPVNTCKLLCAARSSCRWT